MLGLIQLLFLITLDMAHGKEDNLGEPQPIEVRITRDSGYSDTWYLESPDWQSVNLEKQGLATLVRCTWETWDVQDFPPGKAVLSLTHPSHMKDLVAMEFETQELPTDQELEALSLDFCAECEDACQATLEGGEPLTLGVSSSDVHGFLVHIRDNEAARRKRVLGDTG